MIKRRLLSTITIFLFVFIFVTLLIPSALNAETQNFWVDTSHWETEKVWVTSGYFKDTQEKRWVDTSHRVYQGYWKDVTKSFWVDTSQWVSSGYWKDVTERVWVKSGYWAYRYVKKWVNTSHWETMSYNVWVDTSHWETRSYDVWVKSGYWKNVWVDTSHFEWVRIWGPIGYWKWVKSGYYKKVWVDTSYWKTVYYKVWVTSGYWKAVYYNVWVESGYWTTVSEAYWVDTSHWEDQKVWVEGHYEMRYRYVEDWQPCNVTFVFQLMESEPKNVILSRWRKDNNNPYKGTINGKMYWYNKSYYDVFPANNLFPDPSSDESLFKKNPWIIFKIKYECYEVLNLVKESYSEWVEGGPKREWVDTSHFVESGYWQSYNYKVWVDTSYWVEEGHWETVTVRTWVDTSHYETKKVWVEDGFYVSSLHGEVIVEKSPKYIFTRWHKDRNNEECSMKLNVSWKVDNSELLEGEEEKEIVRIYIYQDICRFNNKGIEKVTVFNGNVTPSVEGSINTITKFDYSGSEESILHIYLYAQNGESAHVYFSNPINGFRSINLSSEGSNSDANTWLGGYNYGKFEF